MFEKFSSFTFFMVFTLETLWVARNHADSLKVNFAAEFYILYFAFHYPSTKDCLFETFIKNK